MALEHWIILALATWRATSLLADEEGPFNIFEKVRLALGIMYLEDGTRQAGETRIRWRPLRVLVQEIAKNVLCTWCCSLFIVGPTWIVLYLLFGPPVVYIAAIFASSTVTAWIDKRIWVGHRR